MTAETLLADLQLLGPEILLAIGAMALLLLGVYWKKEEQAAQIVTNLTLVLFALVAGWAVLISPDQTSTAFGGAFIHDSYSLYAKAAIAIAAIAMLLMASSYMKSENLARFEFPVLMALAVLGMFFMVSANDLITLYLGLEMQSLSLYILAAFNRDSLRASEAGLKYFVLGALSSGLLLFGSSWIYGFAGSTSFEAIALAAGGEPNAGLIVGLVFVICGLAFKISAAPFHMWTPDVYEGSPTPVTAFFATAPKLAAMALLARVLTGPFEPMIDSWQQVIIVLAILSMLVGSFGALMQTNIKRLMAYSSIGNMGYALVGLAAGTQTAIWAVLLFMTLYIIGVSGAFGVILSMRRSEGMVERIDDLAGLAQQRPGMGLAITALLLSIGGMPFLVGFFGKLFLFYAAIEAGLVWLAVLGALFSTVSIAYYLSVLKRVWFDEAEAEFEPAPNGVSIVTRVTALGTVVLLPFVALIFARVIQAGGALGG